MGLIKMVKGAVGSTFRDAVKDYFRCDGMSNDYLCIPAVKVMRDGTVNNSTDRIITNGSVFDVAVSSRRQTGRFRWQEEIPHCVFAMCTSAQ